MILFFYRIEDQSHKNLVISLLYLKCNNPLITFFSKIVC
jgi:hypothetical protein